jgi:hypothetical protein
VVQTVGEVHTEHPSPQALQVLTEAKKNLEAQVTQEALDNGQVPQLAAVHLVHFALVSKPFWTLHAVHLVLSAPHFWQLASVQARQDNLSETLTPKVSIHSSQVVAVVHLWQLATEHLVQPFLSRLSIQPLAQASQVSRVVHVPQLATEHLLQIFLVVSIKKPFKQVLQEVASVQEEQLVIPQLVQDFLSADKKVPALHTEQVVASAQVVQLAIEQVAGVGVGVGAAQVLLSVEMVNPAAHTEQVVASAQVAQLVIVQRAVQAFLVADRPNPGLQVVQVAASVQVAQLVKHAAQVLETVLSQKSVAAQEVHSVADVQFPQGAVQAVHILLAGATAVGSQFLSLQVTQLVFSTVEQSRHEAWVQAAHP